MLTDTCLSRTLSVTDSDLCVHSCNLKGLDLTEHNHRTYIDISLRCSHHLGVSFPLNIISRDRNSKRTSDGIICRIERECKIWDSLDNKTDAEQLLRTRP